MKTLLRYIFLTFIGITAFLVLFVAVSVAPVDRTHVRTLPAYQIMMGRLDTVTMNIPPAKHGFLVGFGKTNITPQEPIATAGYGKRKGKPYHVVHDSIYVRAMVVDNGSERVAIVSADLLIIPPTVTQVLQSKLAAIGFSLDNTYLGATHSHNSIGDWGEGATRFIYGPYEAEVVQFLADAIVESIRSAQNNLLPSRLKSGAIAIPQAVENRLIDGGNEDPFLRAIEVHRSDSSKLALMSYAAHATCLSQRTIELSRDYPGMLVDALEARDYEFAMFMAGGVGSHKGSAPENDWSCMAWMSDVISEQFFASRHTFRDVADSVVGMVRLPLALSEPQVKISDDWKVRAWLFRAAFGEYDASLTALRLGDVVMLGTPCDFSGEYNQSLDSLAHRKGLEVMVTSFNGGYIGYLTPEKYYDVNHYETMLMNWYARGTGDYVKECLEKLMTGMSDTK
ncbi:MAG: neutral/alkaline non-lysosomal ceramidase N-terminal domain-containing protein [Chryseosolibacter sp.]